MHIWDQEIIEAGTIFLLKNNFNNYRIVLNLLDKKIKRTYTTYEESRHSKKLSE